MRKNYYPKIDKITDDIDAQGYLIENLGHLKVQSIIQTENGILKDFKVPSSVMGKEWLENEKPLPIYDELTEPTGWQATNDEYILVVSDACSHLKPVRLTSNSQSTLFKEFPMNIKSTGYISFWMGNNSLVANKKAILKLMHEVGDVERLQVIMEEGNIKIVDANGEENVGLYSPQYMRHFAITWTKDYCYLFLDMHPIKKFKLMSDEKFIDKFMFLWDSNDSTNACAMFVDAVSTSLDGNYIMDIFDNISPGTVNASGIFSNKGLIENLDSNNIRIGTEGDYKTADGILGKNWNVDDQNPFRSILSILDHAEGYTDITCYGPHGFIDDDFVVIEGTTNYNGVYQVVSVNGNSFEINKPYNMNENDTGIVYLNHVYIKNILGFSDGTNDKTQVICELHGFSDMDQLIIQNTLSYNNPSAPYTVEYIDENNFKIDKTFVIGSESETGIVFMNPTLLNQKSAFSEFSQNINAVIDDNFDNHNNICVMTANEIGSITTLKYGISSAREIGIFDFFFNFNLKSDQQFSIQLLNNDSDEVKVIEIILKGGMIYNNDEPIYIYDENTLSHFHIEFMKDSCFLYLNKKFCATLTFLTSNTSIDTIKFYAINQSTSSEILIGYLDALGISWNSYSPFSNYNSGQLQSQGIESKDMNVESSMSEILQVDALGNYKKPFGIIGKNWEIGETEISKYGFINPEITAKIINSIQGHNKVLELSKGAGLSSISLPLGLIDKLDYEIFIFVENITSQIQFGGYYYIDAENYGNVNKLVIDSNGNISYTDETPLGDGSYGTNYSLSFNKWNHFRVEWRKGLYFIVFLNGNEIIKITESSLGLNNNFIEQFEIDLENSTIYIDAIAFNTHTKNYGYNKYSNMSDGVGIFKGVHADRAIIKQVRSKIADVNSSGNFKIPAGILGKDWSIGMFDDESGEYCGWNAVVPGGTHNIVQSHKGHNFVMELMNHKTKYAIPYTAEILYDIHIFPPSSGTFEFGIQSLDPIGVVAQILLDDDRYVKFKTNNGVWIDTGFHYGDAGSEDWIHFSVAWINSQYLQIKIDGQTIVETVGTTVAYQDPPDQTSFDFTLNAGTDAQVYVDAIGLSCFGYKAYYNIKDGIMAPKGVISEKLQTADAIIENANVKYLDNVTTLKVKQIQSQPESVFHFNSSDKVNYWGQYVDENSVPVGWSLGTQDYVGGALEYTGAINLLKNYNNHKDLVRIKKYSNYGQTVLENTNNFTSIGSGFISFWLAINKEKSSIMMDLCDSTGLAHLSFLIKNGKIHHVKELLSPKSISGFSGRLTANITSFSDAGSNQTIVSCSSSFSDGDFVQIANTSNYNGVYQVFGWDANSFKIEKTFVSTETGTVFLNDQIKVDCVAHGFTDENSQTKQIIIEGTDYDGIYSVIDPESNLDSFKIGRTFSVSSTNHLGKVSLIDLEFVCPFAIDMFQHIIIKFDKFDLVDLQNFIYLNNIPINDVGYPFRNEFGVDITKIRFIADYDAEFDEDFEVYIDAVIFPDQGNGIDVFSENSPKLIVENTIGSQDHPFEKIHAKEIHAEKIYGLLPDANASQIQIEPMAGSEIPIFDFNEYPTIDIDVLCENEPRFSYTEDGGSGSVTLTGDVFLKIEKYGGTNCSSLTDNIKTKTGSSKAKTTIEFRMKVSNMLQTRVELFGENGYIGAIMFWGGTIQANYFTPNYNKVTFLDDDNQYAVNEWYIITIEFDSQLDKWSFKVNGLDPFTSTMHERTFLNIDYASEIDYQIHPGNLYKIKYASAYSGGGDGLIYIDYLYYIFGETNISESTKYIQSAIQDLDNSLTNLKTGQDDVIVKTLKVVGENTGNGVFQKGEPTGNDTEIASFNGSFKASKVYGAVYNDYADYWHLSPNEKLIFGKVYTADGKINNKRGNRKIIGICTDTPGIEVGSHEGDLPISVAGWPLAFVDKKYESGTFLIPDKFGNLTKARWWERYKAIAIYLRAEQAEYFRQVKVNGRSWIKVIK